MGYYEIRHVNCAASFSASPVRSHPIPLLSPACIPQLHIRIHQHLQYHLTSKQSLYSPSITAVASTRLDELQSSYSDDSRPHGFHSSSSISNMPAPSREYSRYGPNSITSTSTSKAINELQAISSSLIAGSSSTLRTTTSESQKMQRPHIYVQILIMAAIAMYQKVFAQ